MRKQRNSRFKVTEYLSASSAHECVACWQCVDVCPRQVLGKVKILWHRHVKVKSPDRCVGCGKCVNVCPKSIFRIENRI